MVDRFEELRTYVAIVEAGGVNAAAARVGIARSAVSRRLSELEARLGTVLVERSTRRFELTALGHAFYDDSRRVLDDPAALDGRFGGAPPAAERITVAADRDVVAMLAAALARFHAARTGTTVELVDADQEADVTVRVADGGRGRRIGELARVVVAAPTYLEAREAPSTPASLAGHVGSSVRGAVDEWTVRKGGAVAPDVALEVGDAQAALALALAGAGLARLPLPVCAAVIDSGALKVLLSDHAPKPTAVFAEATGASPLAAALVDELASRNG